MAQEAGLQQTGAPAAADADFAMDDFSALLQKEFKPGTDSKRDRIEQAVKTLAQQALADADIVSDDVFVTLDAMKAAIDRKLTEQVDLIIHDEGVSKLEVGVAGAELSRL
ncbi:hypothetical protein AB5I41_09340 [Sphingomonas sp. MMS24-JH45]